jgi:hypothetical protein
LQELNVKKKSKYKPKGVRVDTLAYVMSGIMPFKRVSEGITVRIKNHDAINNLRLGQATKADIDIIIGAVNMTDALARLKLGNDWAEEIRQGQDALLAIARRGKTSGKFIGTGPELTAILLIMEIHDAQLDACTVKDIELAMDIMDKEHRHKLARVI